LALVSQPEVVRAKPDFMWLDPDKVGIMSRCPIEKGCSSEREATMAGLSHIWTTETVFQAARTTANWTWPVGEREDYWGYCVRPWQANSNLSVVTEGITTDNNLSYTQNFQIATGSGGLMRFSAIRVAGS
jgi:hypothetical protein